MSINPLENTLYSRMQSKALELERKLESSAEKKSPLADRVQKLVQVLKQPNRQLEEIQVHIERNAANGATAEIQEAWADFQGNFHLLYLQHHLSEIKQDSSFDDLEAIDQLEKLIADIDPSLLQGEVGNRLLLLCISDKRLQACAARLIEKDVAADGADEQGNTLWHYLADFDRIGLVRTLFDKQPAGIWAKPNRKGETPVDRLLNLRNERELISFLVDEDLLSVRDLEKIIVSNSSQELIKKCLGLRVKKPGCDLQKLFHQAIGLEKNATAYLLYVTGATLTSTPDVLSWAHSVLSDLSKKTTYDESTNKTISKPFDAGACRLLDFLVETRAFQPMPEDNPNHLVNVYNRLREDKQSAFLKKMEECFGVTDQMVEALIKLKSFAQEMRVYSISGNKPPPQITVELEEVLKEMQPWIDKGFAGAKVLCGRLRDLLHEQKSSLLTDLSKAVDGDKPKPFDAAACRLLDSLVEAGAFFPMPQDNPTLLEDLLKRLPAVQRSAFLEKMEARYGVTSAMIETVKELQKLWILTTESPSMNPSISREEIQGLEKILSEMQAWLKIGGENAAAVNKKLQMLLEKRKHMLGEAEKWLKNPEEWKGVSKEIRQLAVEWALNEGRYELAAKALPFCDKTSNPSSRELYDKPVFHFLLDKIRIIKEESNLAKLEGSLISENAIVLEDALNRTVNSSSVESLPPLLHPVIRHLQNALLVCASWGQQELEKINSSCPRIVKAIKEVPLNTPILIPGGHAQHGTAIAISKTGEEEATVFFYNTGLGMFKNHPKHPTANKYQTHLAYDNVPLSLLTNVALWERFMKIRATGSNEDLYKELKQFTVTGVERAPSTNLVEYEQSQMQGTCTAQCLMAFLRHQLMLAAPGTPMDKLGAYRFLKARTIEQIAAPRLSNLSEVVKPLAEKQLAKLALDYSLFEAAQNSKTYAHHLQQLLAAQPELKDELQKLKADSSLGRYAILRHLHSLLARQGFVASKEPPAYTKALLSKQTHNREKLGEQLELLANKKDWETLSDEFTRTWEEKVFRETLTQWLTRRFPDKGSAENNPFIKLLAGAIQKQTACSGLLEDLESKGRQDLAALLKTLPVSESK